MRVTGAARDAAIRSTANFRSAAGDAQFDAELSNIQNIKRDNEKEPFPRKIDDSLMDLMTPEQQVIAMDLKDKTGELSMFFCLTT